MFYLADIVMNQDIRNYKIRVLKLTDVSNEEKVPKDIDVPSVGQ